MITLDDAMSLQTDKHPPQRQAISLGDIAEMLLSTRIDRH
jgi:hypothetical protein